MGPWIAVFYLLGNNDQAGCITTEESEGQWAERFGSVDEIKRLKSGHIMHAFPWFAINVETGKSEVLL